MVLRRCPAQFCEFRSEKLTSYFNRMSKQKGSSPFLFFFFFSDKLWRLLYFFGSLYRSYLSKKKVTKKASFPFVGRCMTNTLSSNHVPTRNIERGVANLPLRQHLGWPSSYMFTAHAPCPNDGTDMIHDTQASVDIVFYISFPSILLQNMPALMSAGTVVYAHRVTSFKNECSKSTERP